ncbi:MAG: hypothetical protein KatS3mg102_1347 [Planctomycetota bacterium]|nr:MAG: hypothetical protein KatS3mg102_1347 [Planctomycetota bacterium]
MAAGRRLKGRAAAGAGYALAVLALLAALAGWLVPEPDRQALEQSLVPPCLAHPAGTDLMGRDLLARTLHGLRLSLLIGLLASALAVAIGLVVGMLAGYAGGWLDALLMRTVDVLYGLPYIALVVVLMMVLGRGVANLLVALAAVGWLTTARIVRAEVRRLRAREFVEAARVLGAGPLRVLARHLAPNLLGIVLVYAALSVPAAIRQEALLSFLGLGVEPPQASLGSLLREGLGALSVLGAEWWLLAAPAGVLIALVGALNALADWASARRTGP